MTQPSPEAVMANVASNAQDLERAKEHARLLLEKVASGPIGDGLSHAEYALLCLHAHVTALTTQLEAEQVSEKRTHRELKDCTAKLSGAEGECEVLRAINDDLTTRLADATARAEAAEAEKNDLTTNFANLERERDGLRAMTASLGARDVLYERVRQINVEGWSETHDDMHAAGKLSLAGALYALEGSSPDPRKTVPAAWPWAHSWWKPSSFRRRNLVKAGALIIAEIDRLDRTKNEPAMRAVETDYSELPDRGERDGDRDRAAARSRPAQADGGA